MRAKRKRIEACCKSLEGLWRDMFATKKTCVKAAGAPKVGLAPHATVFTAGRGVCSACGATFTKHGSSGDARQEHQIVHRKMQDKGSHSCEPLHMHCETVSGAAITFCSLCGAYGSQKEIKLRQKCEPQDRAKLKSQWTSIMKGRRHTVSKEAIVNFQRASVLG